MEGHLQMVAKGLQNLVKLLHVRSTVVCINDKVHIYRLLMDSRIPLHYSLSVNFRPCVEDFSRSSCPGWRKD